MTSQNSGWPPTYGGFAFARESNIERKWRDVRLYQTAPISTNLILAYLGHHVLGMGGNG